jgi:hypothetical protein
MASLLAVSSFSISANTVQSSLMMRTMRFHDSIQHAGTSFAQTVTDVNGTRQTNASNIHIYRICGVG